MSNTVHRAEANAAAVRWMRLSLLLAAFALMVTSVRLKSPTFDEPAHLFNSCLRSRYGADGLRRPVYFIQGLLCALAPELPEFESSPSSGVEDRNDFYERLGFELDLLIVPGRLLGAQMMLLVGALLYRWGKESGGERTGILALALAAYDPNLLAHGRLVTTDGLTTLLTISCLYLYCHGLTRRKHRVAYLGGAIAVLILALLNKSTSYVLLPLLALMTLVAVDFNGGWRKLAAQAVGLVVLYGIFSIIYGVASGTPVRGSSLWDLLVPFQRRLLSIMRQAVISPGDTSGWPAYMLGSRSMEGWPIYFPLLFLVKTPLPLLVASGFGMVALLRERRWLLATSLSLPLWMLIVYLRLPLNIGYRHLLPVVPALILLAAHALSGMRRRWISAALVVWVGLGSLSVYPDFLTYFNEIAGGARGGVEFFSDSNLDWGQDLRGLQQWMERHDVDHIYLDYFGAVDPALYGINYSPVQSDLGTTYLNGFTPISPPPGLYAISATSLTGQYLWDNPSVFAWFRSQEPLARIGHSILVYEVAPDPLRPEWGAVCLPDGLPPLQVRNETPQLDLVRELEKGAGLPPDARVVVFDCRRGWPLLGSPADPAWLLIPGIVEDLPPTDVQMGQVELVYLKSNYAGTPLYAVYRWEPAAPAPSAVLEQNLRVRVGDVLDLEAALVPSAAAQAGDTVSVQLVWHVVEQSRGPLSFMAHLWHEDGALVANDDGAAVPSDQWLVGDRFVNVHRLEIPADAEAGRYRVVVGAYSLPDVVRLPVTTEGGEPIGDCLEVAVIEIASGR